MTGPFKFNRRMTKRRVHDNPLFCFWEDASCALSFFVRFSEKPGFCGYFLGVRMLFRGRRTKTAKLVLPVRAVETAGAAVLRRSGLAAVKMICARPRLHELFKGPVAAGSKIHRRSPPFWFWARKKRRPDLPKGEKRTPPSAVSYSIFDVSLFGRWASREEEACQSSIRK